MRRRTFLKWFGLCTSVPLMASGFGPHVLSRPNRRPDDRRRIFIRPFNPEGYGRGDGTSYEHAFNGLENAVLEPSAVHYFCGYFQAEWDGRSNIANQFAVAVPSGSASARTELRGDWPNDPGIIVGGVIPNWGPWRDAGNGVFSLPIRAGFGDSWYFEADREGKIGSSLVRARTLSACRKKAGSFWSDTYSQFTGTRQIFVHLSDSASPAGRVIFGRYGWRFDYGPKARFIDMIGLDMRVFGFFSQYSEILEYCSWQKCQFTFGGHSMFRLFGAAKSVSWKHCKISRAANGIYFIADKPEHGAVENYQITNCQIEDIGTDMQLANDDEHAIGIQGSRNGLVKGNRIQRCGRHIVLYASDQHDPRHKNGVWYQPMEDIRIEQNHVSDWNGSHRGRGIGITINCDQTHKGSKSGLVIRGNWVSNMNLGIRVKSDVNVVVEENRLSNCNVGFMCLGTNSGAWCTFRKNTLDNIKNYFVILGWIPKKTKYIGSKNIYILGIRQYGWSKLFRDRGNAISITKWRYWLKLKRGSVMDLDSRIIK